MFRKDDPYYRIGYALVEGFSWGVVGYFDPDGYFTEYRLMLDGVYDLTEVLSDKVREAILEAASGNS